MSGVGLAAGAIVSAVGAGVQANNANKNKNNQLNQLAASNATQAGLDNQAMADVNGTANAIGNSTPAAGTNQLLGAYKAALAQAAPSQGAALPAISGASSRYAKGVASAKANINDYATAMAKNMATTGGAQLQRISDANRIAQTASDLGALQTQSGNTTGALKTQLAGDQANPWTNALGSVAEGVGSGMMSGGLSGMGGSAPAGAAGDFTGIDPSTGLANGPTFMGGSYTPAYSTGFNAAMARPVGGYSNPFL